jgi:hypothetical protein
LVLGFEAIPCLRDGTVVLRSEFRAEPAAAHNQNSSDGRDGGNDEDDD